MRIGWKSGCGKAEVIDLTGDRPLVPASMNISNREGCPFYPELQVLERGLPKANVRVDTGVTVVFRGKSVAVMVLQTT